MKMKDLIMKCINLWVQKSRLEEANNKLKLLEKDVERDKSINLNEYNEEDRKFYTTYIQSHLEERNNLNDFIIYLNKYINEIESEIDEYEK